MDERSLLVNPTHNNAFRSEPVQLPNLPDASILTPLCKTYDYQLLSATLVLLEWKPVELVT